MKDLTIIVPTVKPKTLANALHYIHSQKTDGIDFEVIIIQESNDVEQFATLTYGPNFSIIRQNLHADHGAAARDRGITEARGEYVAFWDDDNIYYPHAMASVLCTAVGNDVGIVRTKHQGLIIPSGPRLKAGDIDTMCFCVRKELAAKVEWADKGGRYCDFRWITKIAGLAKSINRSPIIIGEHL